MTNDIVVEDNRPLLYILFLAITIFCFALSTRGVPDSCQLLTGNACCDRYVYFGSEQHSDLNELFVNELILYYKTAIIFSVKLLFCLSSCNYFDIEQFDFTHYKNTNWYPYISSHLRKIRSVVLLN